jgi:thiamine biosynthesis lipoprotein
MPQRIEFDAIGTHWTLDLDTLRPQDIVAKIQQRIKQFDKDYSRFRPDSLIMAMANKGGDYTLPADAQPLFDMYRQLYELTQGAVTPLIGQVLVDAGYDASYSLQPKTLHRPPDWGEVLAYNYPVLQLKQPALLDVGALGKGYLVDIIGTLLDDNGVAGYTINAGGDILHHSATNQTIRVGLEHPDNPHQAIGVATIRNQSLCGSATNRRAWDRFHHVINPHTLTSPQQLRAVWALAEQAIVGDALTTALFFATPHELKQHFVFEYAIIKHDHSLEHSPNFPAEFFDPKD